MDVASGGDDISHPISHGELQGPTQQPLGLETHDIWQAPVNFEWDQWEAYIERFPGEILDLNGV